MLVIAVLAAIRTTVFADPRVRVLEAPVLGSLVDGTLRGVKQALNEVIRGSGALIVVIASRMHQKTTASSLYHNRTRALFS
jgi:hypothetical protein